MGIDGSTIKKAKERAKQKDKKSQEREEKKRQKQQQREENYQNIVEEHEKRKQGIAKEASYLPKLDCAACKAEGTMIAAKIPRFSGFIRFIGILIAIPSVLGVLFAILILFSTGSATNEVMSTAQSDAETAGAAIGATIGFGFSAFIGFSSLVGGLIGWLLLMKKKVFKCIRCSYIIDRG